MKASMFLVILLALVGCKSKKEVAEEAKRPSMEIPAEYTGEKMWTVVKPELVKLTLLAVSTGACYGECPIYDLNISQTGMVSLNAKKFMPMQGVHQSQLSKEQLEELKGKIADLEYMKLEDVYDNPQVTDVPTTKLFFNTGEPKEMKVRMGAPDGVKEFMNWLYPFITDLKYDKLEVE